MLPYSLLTRLSGATAMRAMDEHAIKTLGIPGIVLMENAARSVADFIEEHVLESKSKARIVVCCGKGNNGGDGFAIARLLKNRGIAVTVISAGTARTEDAKLNQKLWKHFGKSITYPCTEASEALQCADVIVDAIFGTGLERVIEGSYYDWVKEINANTQSTRIAVDIPSGVHADDSTIMGIAVQCHHTVALQVQKIGCAQYPGVGYAGQIHIKDISIPVKFPHDENSTYLLTEAFVSEALPQLNPETHKGSQGHLLCICGSAGMGGAASLVAHAALRTGCGLLTACVPKNLQDSLPQQSPEVMTLSPEHSLSYFKGQESSFVVQAASTKDAVIIGCGLGLHRETYKFCQSFLDRATSDIDAPLLIDADGLNHITTQDLNKRALSKQNLNKRALNKRALNKRALNKRALNKHASTTVLTPHPKELSRLSGVSVEAIQRARIQTVRHYAVAWSVVLLLKGPYTVIGSPDGTIYINPTGHAGMATAGSGDVLSGIIGSLMAQGLSPLNATLTGVFLHGRAADLLKTKLPPVSLMATDLIQELPHAFSSCMPD